MSRRARSSKEGTFLESVKVELQKLSIDLAEVKSAMRSLSDGFMGSASMHVPASQDLIGVPKADKGSGFQG